MQLRGKATGTRKEEREKRLLEASDGNREHVEIVKRLLRPADARAERMSRRTSE